MTTWRRPTRSARRARVEQELDKELQFHLDQLTQKHSAAGVGPERAARAARQEFGA